MAGPYNGKTNAEQRLHVSIDHAVCKKAANQKISRYNNMWYKGCGVMLRALSALMVTLCFFGTIHRNNTHKKEL